VRGGSDDDFLEFLGLYVAVAVLVKVLEGLTDTLSLEPAQHLGELRVVHLVPLVATTGVQRGPLGVPIERQSILGLVEVIELFELGKLDGTGAAGVEEAEGYLVLGIGLGKEVLEVGPVSQADAAGLAAVGNTEEEAILLPLDFVLSHLSVTGVTSRVILT